MSDALDRTLAAAIAAGVLPPDAARPNEEARPWPVVLLTALGAWLAVIPLVIVIGMLLGDWISRDLGLYLVGVLVLSGAVVTLRSRDLPLFVEQLAVPALMVGLGSLAFALGEDLPKEAAAAILGALALALAAALPRPWLRVLLGAAAAALLTLALILALLAPRDLFVLDGMGRMLGLARPAPGPGHLACRALGPAQPAGSRGRRRRGRALRPLARAGSWPFWLGSRCTRA